MKIKYTIGIVFIIILAAVGVHFYTANNRGAVNLSGRGQYNMSGVYNSSELNLIDGEGAALALDSNGKQILSSNSLIQITGSDTSMFDAFGNMRVSNPITIFDSKNIYDNADIANTADQQPLFFDNQETSGGGTATEYATSSQILSVSATTAGTRVRQTKMRFNYQPGKSQRINMTFNMNGTQAGITKREGIFDDNNGLFLEFKGTDVRLVRRSNATSTVAQDFGVSQADWNLDSMDGTTTSTINLDWEKTQIMYIDYEWLGVGRVRIGFVVAGQIKYVHQFLNANIGTEVYMKTPNLPLRSEISNDGTGVAATITQICSTVISEGGSQETGVIHATSTAGASVTFPTENVLNGVLGIRLRSDYLDATVNLIDAHVNLLSTTDEIEWIVVMNPTKTDTGTWRNQENSAIQVSTSTPSMVLTGGNILHVGYINSGSAANGGVSSGEALKNAIRLGSLIDGTPDEIWVGIRQIGGTTGAEVEGAISVQEQQ